MLKPPARNACVMAVGKNGKLSVGFGERSRNTIVSLVACDLYNASRETESTELLDVPASPRETSSCPAATLSPPVL